MGADILTYPSAFTYETGSTHWETLLRARAIENQCYVIAAAQTGFITPHQRTWGHAMVRIILMELMFQGHRKSCNTSAIILDNWSMWYSLCSMFRWYRNCSYGYRLWAFKTHEISYASALAQTVRFVSKVRMLITGA